MSFPKLIFDWMSIRLFSGQCVCENFSLSDESKISRLVDLDLDRQPHGFPLALSHLAYFTRVGFDAKNEKPPASDKCRNVRLAGHENNLFLACLNCIE